MFLSKSDKDLICGKYFEDNLFKFLLSFSAEELDSEHIPKPVVIRLSNLLALYDTHYSKVSSLLNKNNGVLRI